MLQTDASPRPGGAPALTYVVGDKRVDSVELKALLVTRGLKVDGRVYREFAGRYRLHPDPLRCNTLLLPDGTVVQLTDLAFHMRYLRGVLSRETLAQLRYLPQLRTPFTLRVDADGQPAVLHDGTFVTRVTFPPATDFYDRTTSSGLPYAGNAVLQGREWVSFQCLWSCDYATAGSPCAYCYSGGVFESAARRHKPLPRFPTPEDAAEIVASAFAAGEARSIQITGGSMLNRRAEIDRVLAYLTAIYRRVPRSEISGEIVVYVTATDEPSDIDVLFAAGADRVSASLEIWDPELAAAIMPGKMRHTGRARQMACLSHIAAVHGRNRGCSNFIIGLEPVELVLAGAETLAAMGIAPIASVWIPFGRPVLGRARAPDLAYYRAVKEGFARIYRTYGVCPPGGEGLNVCFCRDIWQHQDEIAAATEF